ncbi:MAG: hypothetical protein JNL76_00445 [Alphaproteobacteria bacterium]|nr:hypothetical protein [Alphaproteobacteria bacterium]
MINAQLATPPLLALDMRLRVMDMLCRKNAAEQISTETAQEFRKPLSDFYLDSLETMDEELQRLFSDAFSFISNEDGNTLTDIFTKDIGALALELELDDFAPDLFPVPFPDDRYDPELLKCVPFFAACYPLYLAAEREKKRLFNAAVAKRNEKHSVPLETSSPEELKKIFHQAVAADHKDATSYIIGDVTSYITHHITPLNQPRKQQALTRVFVETSPENPSSCFFIGGVISKDAPHPPLPFATGDYIALNHIYPINPQNSRLLTKLFSVQTGRAARTVTRLPAAFLERNSFPFHIIGGTHEHVLDGKLGRILIIEDVNGTQRLVPSQVVEGLASAGYGQPFLLATGTDLSTAHIIGMPTRMADIFWPRDCSP